MIPLRDVIPSRTTPFVTIGLIGLNTLAWMFELSLPEAAIPSLVMMYGIVPAFFRWPAVLTSMFLHAGWLHFLGNMLSLWIFGDNVEDRLGHVRYLAFYLVCGAIAAVAQVVSAPGSMVPTIGASGAIAGVMGAYFVLYPRSRVLTMIPPFIFWVIEVPAIVFLGMWFLMQVFSGVGSIAYTTGTQGSGIAFWAHVAGFVAGIGGVLALRPRKRQTVEWWSER